MWGIQKVLQNKQAFQIGIKLINSKLVTRKIIL